MLRVSDHEAPAVKKSRKKKVAKARKPACFVYLLRTCDDGRPMTYVGWTTDIDARLAKHNAGTGARLLMGLVATHPLTAFFTGDASLRKRPMERVALPLRQMGAQIHARQGGRLPLALIGAREPMPITYTLPVASAQIKSAVLLAGLNAPGATTVIEPEPTRDHTELMLRYFGVDVRVAQTPQGRAATVIGQPEIEGRDIRVPADPSSAGHARC